MAGSTRPLPGLPVRPFPRRHCAQRRLRLPQPVATARDATVHIHRTQQTPPYTHPTTHRYTHTQTPTHIHTYWAPVRCSSTTPSPSRWASPATLSSRKPGPTTSLAPGPPNQTRPSLAPYAPSAPLPPSIPFALTRIAQGFYDPLNDELIEPNRTGISYSFTGDGHYEEAYYRAISNPVTPSCPSGIMQWQHGTWVMNANGSLSLTPIAVDGRQLLSSPCQYNNAIYTRYNQSELFQVRVIR